MPAVDGKQTAAGDGDGCWYAEVRERVGRHVGDGGVGGELEHHDDVLLHLILKHQRALGKETLVRQTERKKRKGQRRRDRGRGKERKGKGWRSRGGGEDGGKRERQNGWDRGGEGKR